MKNNNYEFLFLKDEHKVKNEKDLIEYEKKLYQSFIGTWTIKKSEIIDNCRLRLPIPFEDLLIFIIKLDNDIIAGISGHINSNIKWQAEKMGFNLSITDKVNACEGLTLFIRDNTTIDFFFLLEDIFKKIIKLLKEKNINKIFTTCSEDLRNMYYIMGFNEVSNILLNGKKEYLLKLDI